MIWGSGWRVALVLAFLAAPASAVMPDPATRSGSTDPDHAEAERLIEQGRHDVALPLLRAALSRAPGDPDLHSAMGFALRKTGRLDESHAHYREALRLDPDHREAREYLGELYLMRGDLDAARGQLAELARLCPSGCEERTELEEAIARAGR